MNKLFISLLISILTVSMNGQDVQKDDFKSGNTSYSIYFIGHGSLMVNVDGYAIYIDPVAEYTDYSKLPKADLVLITHDHGDHFDTKALSTIEKTGTRYLVSKTVKAKFDKGELMKNGDKVTVNNIVIEAFPAYNTTKQQFHPKSNENNGYILNIGSQRVYIAGDCEDMPELDQLENIYIAFLPVNQPYTMTVDQAINAAKMVNPKILYPYHFSETDLNPLVKALESTNIDVRIRKLQ